MKATAEQTARYNYNHTAWFYQPLAALYSAGLIKASKVAQVAHMQPGERVLYAGVGTGEDALEAARKGLRLTCIDLSPAMLERTRHKIEQQHLPSVIRPEFICGDIMQHDRPERYDIICANYFLNVFAEPLMVNVLAHLTTLLKPGGRLMIADFSLPHGNWLQKGLHTLYYRIANTFYWSLSGNDLHPIYDYPKYFAQAGIVTTATEHFPLLKYGPAWYWSVTGTKPGLT